MHLLVVFLGLTWLTVFRLRRAMGRKGHWLDFAGPLGLFLFCWPPVAWVLMSGLERGYPVSPTPASAAQAMVVLSGNIYPANETIRETKPGFHTYLRTAHAAWLFRHWQPLPLIVSGGATGEPGDLTLAELMRRQLVEEGVPESMITAEDRSLNTYENAVNTAAILRSRGITRVVLITEAFHMPRASLCFRKQGLDVVPVAIAYRSRELQSWGETLEPGMWGIRNNIDAIHEWGGLAVYKLRGKI